MKDPIVEGILKPKKIQPLPKKCVFSHRINLPSLKDPYVERENPYMLYCSVWIPDVPYSPIKPKIGWTLRAKQDQYIRLIMPNTSSIAETLYSLVNFVEKVSPELLEQLHQAEMEWLEFRKKLSKK